MVKLWTCKRTFQESLSLCIAHFLQSSDLSVSFRLVELLHVVQEEVIRIATEVYASHNNRQQCDDNTDDSQASGELARG